MQQRVCSAPSAVPQTLRPSAIRWTFCCCTIAIPCRRRAHVDEQLKEKQANSRHSFRLLHKAQLKDLVGDRTLHLLLLNLHAKCKALHVLRFIRQRLAAAYLDVAHVPRRVQTVEGVHSSLATRTTRTLLICNLHRGPVVDCARTLTSRAQTVKLRLSRDSVCNV